MGHPVIPGYEWINKPRKNKTGGGVALLIRQDIHHLTEVVEGLEDQDQEVIWVKLENSRTKTHIGIFYGPQEKCSNEEAERQYAQLTTQINKLKAQGEVALMGDFNAKLEIKGDIQQTQTRNGKHLAKMLEDTNTCAISVEKNPTWTRCRKRKDTIEKSIIDYIIMTPRLAQTSHTNVDDAGILKLKGKEETDHSTITAELEIATTPK